MSHGTTNALVMALDSHSHMALDSHSHTHSHLSPDLHYSQIHTHIQYPNVLQTHAHAGVKFTQRHSDT